MFALRNLELFCKYIGRLQEEEFGPLSGSSLHEKIMNPNKCERMWLNVYERHYYCMIQHILPQKKSSLHFGSRIALNDEITSESNVVIWTQDLLLRLKEKLSILKLFHLMNSFVPFSTHVRVASSLLGCLQHHKVNRSGPCASQQQDVQLYQGPTQREQENEWIDQLNGNVGKENVQKGKFRNRKQMNALMWKNAELLCNFFITVSTFSSLLFIFHLWVGRKKSGYCKA